MVTHAPDENEPDFGLQFAGRRLNGCQQFLRYKHGWHVWRKHEFINTRNQIFHLEARQTDQAATHLRHEKGLVAELEHYIVAGYLSPRHLTEQPRNRIGVLRQPTSHVNLQPLIWFGSRWFY